VFNIFRRKSLEEEVEKESVDLSRRRFLGLGLKSIAAAAILSSVPEKLISTAAPEKYNLALKEYGSLQEALMDFETVKKDADIVSGNIFALKMSTQQEKEVRIEPFYASGKINYRAVLNLETKDASSWKDTFDNINQTEPVIGKYAAQIISSKRDENLPIIYSEIKEGIFISFSSDKEEKSLLENIQTLRAAGGKRMIVYYDKGDGFFKTLVGRFETEEGATARARELLQNDSVLDTLTNNELGIVQASKTEEGIDFEWDAIVKEVKILDKKDENAYKAVKKRIAKRNITVKNEMRKTYEMEQIESIINSAVEAHNKTSKTKIDYDFARAIAFCESTYNPRAVGYAIETVHVKTAHGVKNKKVKIAQGRGLFQMMPGTAQKIMNRAYTEEELFNPEISAKVGIEYISYLMESRHIKKADSMTEKLKLVIAAYNGGEPAIYWSNDLSKDGKKMRVYENPKNKGYGQTRNYVPKVSKQYEAFAGKSIF
jgi:soluble lytic murein transglycosylase-like protein